MSIEDLHEGQAAQVYDRISAIDPALGRYLVLTLTGQELPRDIDWWRRQSVRIAVVAAQGLTDHRLAVEIEKALDVGLTTAEIVEVILHTIPYVGIPRPLNVVLAIKPLFQARNLLPVTLKEPNWTPDQRWQVGLDMIRLAHPTSSPALQANLAEIAPRLYDYIIAAAFADIYGRPGLAYHRRQPLTVLALITQGSVLNHATTHVNGALHIGLSATNLIECLINAQSLLPWERFVEGINTVIAACET